MATSVLPSFSMVPLTPCCDSVIDTETDAINSASAWSAIALHAPTVSTAAQFQPWSRQGEETSRRRCSYCLSQQKYVLGVLEIEHIIPKAKGGGDEEENLWLACLVSGFEIVFSLGLFRSVLQHNLSNFFKNTHDVIKLIAVGKKQGKNIG